MPHFNFSDLSQAFSPLSIHSNIVIGIVTFSLFAVGLLLSVIPFFSSSKYIQIPFCFLRRYKRNISTLHPKLMPFNCIRIRKKKPSQMHANFYNILLNYRYSLPFIIRP
ncbi:hypothetical protein CW304_00160 [Bacillus sp. UFRGS-B20]|nr:hypothetical protein CW304_00160 [Bacillus sp. UFRGS-B20]